GRETRLDATGRFAFRGLPEGGFNVLLDEAPRDAGWVVRAAPAVQLKAGQIAEVAIELIKGTWVEGSVVVNDTGKPVADVEVVANCPARPKPSFSWLRARTDTEGHYRLCLPPGEAELQVRSLPPGFTVLR